LFKMDAWVLFVDNGKLWFETFNDVEAVIVVFWFITEDELAGKETFETVACVVLGNVDKVWFDKFDDSEIVELVIAVFWLTTVDALFETVAWVLFGNIDKVWFDRFDDRDTGERVVPVFWLTTGDKLVGNELFEMDAW
jgi:hypothetical protein